MPELIIENACIRFATEPSEGEGWSEYANESWVRPLADSGALLMIDGSENIRSIVFDSDGYPYEMGTHDRETAVAPSPVDKKDVDDAEINWEWHLRSEAVGPDAEHYDVEHNITHVYISPSDPANRGVDGYDSDGYRDDLSFSLEAYIGGEKETPHYIADVFQENDDVQFRGGDVKDEEIQLVLKGTTSEVYINGMTNEFLGRIEEGTISERTTTEDEYQLDLDDDKVLHICRWSLLERVSGNTFTEGFASITGPDGEEESAFTLSENLDLQNEAIAGNYTVMLWCKGAAPIAGVVFAQYGDTVNDWKLLYAQAAGLAANCVVSSGESIFDLRIYDATKQYAAIGDYYRAIRYREGQGYLFG